MHQQFFTLSPMAGQETFNTIETRPSQPTLAHTPTTSAMLAALQQDSFPTPSLDTSATAFAPDAYNSLAYIDTPISQDDSVTPARPPAVFPEYVTAFTPQDLGLSTHTPASSEPENEDAVNSEVT